MRRRSLVIGVAATIAFVGGSLAVLRAIGWHMALRSHIAYFTEEERLYRAYESEMRSLIAMMAGDAADPDVREASDQVFEKLQYLGTATDGEAVDAWREAPHSAGRAAFARAWAEFAADEAAFMAAVNRFYRLSLQRGEWPERYPGPESPPEPPALPGPGRGSGARPAMEASGDQGGS